jgi:uncharacterized membrane protein YfcA
MPDTATLFIVAATFLLAGTVKGVIGLGLPTVSLALLTVAINLPTAMALLLMPSFVTNLWQALVGGQRRCHPAPHLDVPVDGDDHRLARGYCADPG